MSDDFNIDGLSARELIGSIRGELPTHCDFCKKPTDPENLHPEEGGDWACSECLERWAKLDAQPE